MKSGHKKTMTQSVKNNGLSPDNHQHLRRSLIFMDQRLCSVVSNQVGALYYELIQSNKINHRSSLQNPIDAFEPCTQATGRNVSKDEIILQHSNARPDIVQTVKTYLETLDYEILPHHNLTHSIT